MYEIVKFKEEHLKPLIGQASNKCIPEWFSSGLAKNLEKTESVTVVYKEQILMCGGINEYWTGRGQLWAVFNEDAARKNFVPAFRAIKHWITYQIQNKYRRIEMSVDYDFTIGHRRAKLLGFSLDCERARKYLPGGGDCTLYSLVRE